jgi:hypothetical protein
MPCRYAYTTKKKDEKKDVPRRAKGAQASAGGSPKNFA